MVAAIGPTQVSTASPANSRSNPLNYWICPKRKPFWTRPSKFADFEAGRFLPPMFEPRTSIWSSTIRAIRNARWSISRDTPACLLSQRGFVTAGRREMDPRRKHAGFARSGSHLDGSQVCHQPSGQADGGLRNEPHRTAFPSLTFGVDYGHTGQCGARAACWRHAADLPKEVCEASGRHASSPN